MKVKQFELIWEDEDGEFIDYVSFYENEKGYKYNIEEIVEKRKKLWADSKIILEKCSEKIETLEN